MSAPDPRFKELLAKAASGLLVRSDSRQVKPGEIFVALKGVRADGQRFIPQAVEAGAAYVVARSSEGWPGDARAELVLHPDPARALGELARAYFKTDRMPMKLVGVTGTNGKTTVSYLIEYLLAASGRRAGVVGTVNYRWPGVVLESSMTTPDCWKLHELLANMSKAGCFASIIEVSSHALDQDRVAGLAFDVGVMTNLTQDHLDYHPDLDHYFAAKSRLFTDYAAAGQTAVLNYEDPWCQKLLAKLPQAIGYGLIAAPEGVGRPLTGALTASSAKGLSLEVRAGSASWRVDSPLVGRHNAMNLLAAMGAGIGLGLQPKALELLSGFYGVPGRLERVPNARGLDIFVDYAHTPDALENVLSAVRALGVKRLLVVFGCGGDRDRTKRPLMGRAVSKFADVAVLTSDNPRHEDPLAIMEEVKPGLADCPKVVAHPDRSMAIHLAIDEMRPGDALVIAGKGHETYQQVGDVKYPFNDLRVVREILGCD